MKPLLRKLIGILLHGAEATGEHWRQCEFQFSRRRREEPRDKTALRVRCHPTAERERQFGP